ncbi:MAG: hypothetical protein IKI57_04215 [Clostridia bacterium]|nr:hypothetical protein [Clostridia bacterium]
MKKIVTALGNPTLNIELKKYSKYDVLTDDILYQEGLIDFLKQNEADVIIISGILQGQMIISDFAGELRNVARISRIIFIVDTISDEDKNYLISKGIFDILYDEISEISDVIEAIDREEPINIRAQVQSEVDDLKAKLKESKENSIVNNVVEIQRQEVISVFGTNGSGKSSVVANLVKAFSKKTKSKILLIDFDTMNGNLDELLNVNKIPQNVSLIMDENKKCGLNYAADLSIKNRFDTNVLDEIIISVDGFDFLSGNTSLHYCQNVLNEDFYSFLIKCAKEKYDFIFLDLSSNIFLDATKWALRESNRVLFVTENTNICLKKTLQIFDTVFNLWNVYKEKFSIVLNRFQKGIEPDIFSQITKVKVIGLIKENTIDKLESYEKILETLKYIPKKSIIERIKINTKMVASFVTSHKM